MAIPKDIAKIDDLFESAYNLLTLEDRFPTRLLGNLKNRMKMFTGQDYDTQTVKNAFDRYNFKNRFTYDNDAVANFTGAVDDVPEIGQNFIDDKGRYYIFEEFTKDEAGQNVYQFRNNVGTKERFTGSGYSHKLSKTDNIYDLKSAQEYGDDMYELYVHKQKFGSLNVNDRAKYYEENILPIQQRLKERQQKINFDYNYYNDKRGKELMRWSDELTNDKQINRQRTQQQTQQQTRQQTQQQQRTINMDDPSSWTDDDIRTMAQGDPEHAQELINQRDAARNQSQSQQQTSQQQGTINMDDPSSWTDEDIRTMAQGDPEYAQELIDKRNAARSQNQSQQQANQNGPENVEQVNNSHGQTPEQTIDAHNSNAPDPNRTVNNVEQNVNRANNNWRQKIKDQQRAQRGVNKLSIDESTAQVKVDTSDPYNIYKTTTDAQGNTRTQHWTRSNANNGDAKLVSDIIHNNEATYNNITGEYSGPDRSPIDWINADEWNDDYIINRAGDDEELLNSMMNARERKIEAQRKYNEAHPEINQTNTDTGSNADIPNESDIPDVPEGPDMNDPLNWTDEYMDEMSEGDPVYYEHLRQTKLSAERAERYKNIDPSNPSSWTDDYIKDTALNEDEFNWMNEKMRQAKNLDIVDEINQQRRTPESEPNRQQRRQQFKDNRQKGNQQKKKTKKQKEKDKRNEKFNDRHRAQGNDPDEIRRRNRELNEERRQNKDPNQEPKINRGNQQNNNQTSKPEPEPEPTQTPVFDPEDPTTWSDEDIKKMANGDPDTFEDLINRRDQANGVDISGRRRGYYDEMGEIDVPLSGDNEIDDLIARGIEETDVEFESPRGHFGTVDKVMTAVNVLGSVSDYKRYRREGKGVVSSAIRAGANFAIGEALGLWALPVALVSSLPGMAIKGADMLYKENRRMNSAANFQVFGGAQFLDTQQLATMRQSGMEMAKMSQYNLQQSLMGNEATYLHR